MAVIMHKEDQQAMENDSPLTEWLRDRFVGEEAYVSYEEKSYCLVPRGNLIVKQVYLPNRRILRCDWCSPQRKGETGRWFVSVERPSC